MQGSAVQASQDQINWVLTSYIVAAAIMTLHAVGLDLPTASAGKRIFIDLVRLGFTVASVMCGLSQDITGQHGRCSRLLQGVFGAALVPLSQAVLLDINPREKVGQAMAIWGAGIMVGPILGRCWAAG